jgi:hypothetical protein
MNKTFVGLFLVLAGVFLPNIQEWIPDFKIPKSPKLEISEPSKEIKENVVNISDLVTDSKDRLDLAVFNLVFSERVTDYEADSQQINDVYTMAARNVFGDTMKGKYKNYGASLKNLMKETLGSENHFKVVAKEEKSELSKNFNGLAWSLNN